MRHFLDGDGIAAALLVVRGTYLPGTVRCAINQGVRHGEWAFGGPFEFDWPSTKCYSDIRVNEYYLGSGPPMLTIMHHAYHGERNRQRLEARYTAWAGREEILFLGAALDYSVEAFRSIRRGMCSRTATE